MTSRGITPSSDTISSPGRRPAAAAGDPGATTVTRGRLTGDRLPAVGAESPMVDERRRRTRPAVRCRDRGHQHRVDPRRRRGPAPRPAPAGFGGTDAFDPDRPDARSPIATVAAYAGDRPRGHRGHPRLQMWWGGRAGAVRRRVRRRRPPRGPGPGPGQGAAARELRPDGRPGRGASPRCTPPRRRSTAAWASRSCGSYDWRHVPLDLVPTAPAAALDLAAGRVRRSRHPARSTTPMAPTLDGWFDRRRRVVAPDVRSVGRRGASKNRYAYVGAADGDDVAAVVYRYDPSEDRLYELGRRRARRRRRRRGRRGARRSSPATAPPPATSRPRSRRPCWPCTSPTCSTPRSTSDWPWMLRLVDVAGAVAARGWPSAVSGRVELDIVDDVIPANAGPHVLEVADGAASLSRAAPARSRSTSRDLAAIYAGADVRGPRRSRAASPGRHRADVDLLARRLRLARRRCPSSSEPPPLAEAEWRRAIGSVGDDAGRRRAARRSPGLLRRRGDGHQGAGVDGPGLRAAGVLLPRDRPQPARRRPVPRPRRGLRRRHRRGARRAAR